ncbi:MAG: ABC transporter permease [Burkholderiales bacterium]|nr:MAG: ABC transporter permease [Burkholderiales bacterium]
MNWFSKDRSDKTSASVPMLEIKGLNVYYGRAHALQDVSLTLDRGVTAIVGRNGMGKTTLCNTVTGVVPGTGSIRVAGQEILGLPSNRITKHGVAYVPQGRRVWPSLTVDETLALVASRKRDVQRVYDMFPRLAERKSNGGAQLSGGEQQMLAIGRALLLQPRLLVMDEPTEGLAPVIVEHVAKALRELAAEGSIAILLIEQNLGVAIDVADRIGVMVNGRIAHQMDKAVLAADRELQERLLGVRSSGDGDAEEEAPALPESTETSPKMWTVKRSHADGLQALPDPAPSSVRGFNRWNSGSTQAAMTDIERQSANVTSLLAPQSTEPAKALAFSSAKAQVLQLPVAASSTRAAYVVGTFDTKSRELLFIRQCIEKTGLRVVTVDLSTSGRTSTATVHPREVARSHPQGESAVFSGDRGSAVSAMAVAFEHYIQTRRDVGGIISAGGSGGTSLATPAMRALPVGVPKVMVSTVASGDTRQYVGPSDICMMYSVTDVQGINKISEKVLSNAAHALAGMVAQPVTQSTSNKPTVGLTMFGVTTPCLQAVTKQLEETYDCLVFHATGVGGQSMEKLVDSGLLCGVLDITTTEIPDELVGGVFSAGPSRMDVYARHAVPYIGSCGALDMVNFGAMDTVPEKFKNRKLYKHNASVTLMRTTVQECQQIGEFIARKLNAMKGPVRFYIPEGGVSAIDKPGQAFHDPEANRALFSAIEQNFRSGSQRQLIRLPHHINDEAFSDALVQAWHDLMRDPNATGQAKNQAKKRAF